MVPMAQCTSCARASCDGDNSESDSAPARPMRRARRRNGTNCVPSLANPKNSNASPSSSCSCKDRRANFTVCSIDNLNQSLALQFNQKRQRLLLTGFARYIILSKQLDTQIGHGSRLCKQFPDAFAGQVQAVVLARLDVGHD